MVVRALARHSSGMDRAQIERQSSIAGGGTLTQTLTELEQCGFVRRSRDALYQLVDPFTLFYLRFVEKTDDEHFWTKHLLDGGYRAYERNLRNKLAAFARETGTRKALHLTMVTANGIARNQYSGIVQSSVTAEELFG